MSTPWFLTLYAACLAALLGLRFGLEPLISAVSAQIAPAETAPEAVAAVPPKPEGAAEARQAGGAEESSEGQALFTKEQCESYDPELRDFCFHQLARQTAARDPEGSLPICDLLADPETRLECQADIAEMSAPISRQGAERICAGIPSVKWRGQCHFGIGLALAEIDPPYALGMCEKAEVFRDFCRHDVVGEVALEGLEPAVAFCSREEGDELTRKTCWHGIGKYLARRDFAEAAAACRRATPQWQGNCFHGVGWGAAERDPDATLVACEGEIPFRDNCRQGVAHQQKRVDPSRAVALCESIQTAAIRARCLAFVTR